MSKGNDDNEKEKRLQRQKAAMTTGKRSDGNVKELARFW